MKIFVLNYFVSLIGLFGCQNSTEIVKKTDKYDQMSQTKSIEVNGMTVEWTYKKERIFFTISAPTEGWVTLGFNDKNDIAHTNLIFCRVQSGEVEVADHYVVAAGNHQETEKLGGTFVVKDIVGEEKKGKTTVSFSMPIKANDRYHFDLLEGTQRWFICAFSAEDDFNHHSRMREHREITL
jgi:DOMON domain